MTHEKEVAKKLTIFCEFLKKGNAVVLARLCNENKCVVASSVVNSCSLFVQTNTWQYLNAWQYLNTWQYLTICISSP